MATPKVAAAEEVVGVEAVVEAMAEVEEEEVTMEVLQEGKKAEALEVKIEAEEESLVATESQEDVAINIKKGIQIGCLFY